MGTPFDLAVAFVLSAEGAESNDADDPGGLTRFGISSRSHPDIDVSRLTVHAAIDLYRARYWDPYRIERLPTPLAIATFDGAVQHGPRPAIRILQDTVGTEMDAKLGPITLAACWRMDREYCLSRYLARRGVYYAHIAGFGAYGTGWFRRIILLYHYALSAGNGAD